MDLVDGELHPFGDVVSSLFASSFEMAFLSIDFARPRDRFNRLLIVPKKSRFLRRPRPNIEAKF